MTPDETYMQRCLQLAVNGLGHVAPNPLVGCVIVYEGQIISEGFHEKYGEAHAEVNAIKKIENDTRLKKSTLYVNLEPCCHFGKTPPCANLIIDKGIKKVVIGNLDPNPLVAGKGIKLLEDSGIEVRYGILEAECKNLNKRFFTFHEKKRPYIILKWAQTQDGFIGLMPLLANKEDNWITGEESKRLVHQWRTEEEAILVGFNTVRSDNPLLTARLAQGKNPMRIVIDEKLQLSPSLNIFNQDAQTIVFNAIKSDKQNHLHFIKIDFDNLFNKILNELFTLNVSSVIIEGGTKTLNLFIESGIWDEARILINPNKWFNTGISAPKLVMPKYQPIKVGEDNLYIVFK